MARLRGDWLVRLPAAFTRAGHGHRHGRLHRDAVRDGARRPRRHTRPGEVLVTGATGGVGSVAVALLGRLGYTVVAATGKAAEEAT
jgi:acrylyl-CoA reductase (NADPH)